MDFINYKPAIQTYVNEESGSEYVIVVEDPAFPYDNITKLADIDTVPVPE